MLATASKNASPPKKTLPSARESAYNNPHIIGTFSSDRAQPRELAGLFTLRERRVRSMKGEQMRHFCFTLTITVAVLACLVASALGQEVTAGFFGTVQDTSGGVIPSAVIHLRNAGTGRVSQTVSDESGNF